MGTCDLQSVEFFKHVTIYSKIPAKLSSSGNQSINFHAIASSFSNLLIGFCVKNVTLNGLKHFYKSFNSLVFLVCNSKKISLQNRSKSVSSVFLLIYFIFIFVFFSIYICYFFLILSSNSKNKKFHYSFFLFFCFFVLFFFFVFWHSLDNIQDKYKPPSSFFFNITKKDEFSSFLPIFFYNLNSHPLFHLQSSQ